MIVDTAKIRQHAVICDNTELYRAAKIVEAAEKARRDAHYQSKFISKKKALLGYHL